MSRTISELTPGQTVYLDETVDGTLQHVPYYYLGLDESGNCIIRRQYAAIQKRLHSEDATVYDGCEADLWLEDETSGFLSRFDNATKMALVFTQIKCNSIATGEIGTIARRCFLLSYTEDGFATAPDEGPSYLSVLQTATGLTGNNARIVYTETLAVVPIWTRSAVSELQFRVVNVSGYAVSSSVTNGNYWLCPALSVAPATIVSDTTEDTIYLLPDTEKTYREVRATLYLGESTKRPKRARLDIEVDNCTSLEMQISNNAKDVNPAWVDISNGGEAVLENTTKETENWEIGVRIAATSGGKGVVHEAVVILTTDEGG